MSLPFSKMRKWKMNRQNEVLMAQRQFHSANGDNDEMSELVRKWILGNGDWEEGLLSRVIVLEQKVTLLLWLVGIVVAALVGNVVATFFTH